MKPCYTKKAMITILLNNNIIEKKLFLEGEIKVQKLDLNKFSLDSDIPNLQDLGTAMLFGNKQAYAFDGLISKLDLSKLLELHQDSETQIYILEGSLDKRKKENKELLSNKKIRVLEFPSPTENEIMPWLEKRLVIYGLKLEPQAGQYLAEAVITVSGSFDVLRLESELQKLSSFAISLPDKRAVNLEEVTSLVFSPSNIDIWEVLDYVASSNKPQALKFLDKYQLSQQTDGKGAAISLVALLSEQFRSLLLVKTAISEGIPEQQILEDTGWKPGRLFVVKKKLNNFTDKQIKVMLQKLESLDKELKTGNLPYESALAVIFAQ